MYSQMYSQCARPSLRPGALWVAGAHASLDPSEGQERGRGPRPELPGPRDADADGEQPLLKSDPKAPKCIGGPIDGHVLELLSHHIVHGEARARAASASLGWIRLLSLPGGGARRLLPGDDPCRCTGTPRTAGLLQGEDGFLLEKTLLFLSGSLCRRPGGSKAWALPSPWSSASRSLASWRQDRSVEQSKK